MQPAIHTLSIDLNADLGEGYPHDEALLELVTSCSIACGGHAGNAQSMRTVLCAAKRAGVRVGAHPSYPDRDGFGRRRIEMTAEALEHSVASQIAALQTVAAQLGLPLNHVKPHGALYHDVSRDRSLADAVVAAIVGAEIPTVIGPPAGTFRLAAEAHGLTYFAEGFADRAYQADGSLRPRTAPGAVIADDSERQAQALSLARDQCVRSQEGERIALNVQTICLHGDTEGAVATAKAIRQALADAGISVRALHG